MTSHKFHLFTAADGTFVLKESDLPPKTFSRIMEAFTAAKRIEENAPITVYDARGQVVLNTFA